MAAKKKAPTRDERKAKAKEREAPSKTHVEVTRAEKIDSLIAGFDEKFGAKRVQRASTTSSSYLLRRPTGIISMDLGLAGGFPAAAPNVIVGPDGVGKDYLLWRVLSEQQRLYGDDFCCALYLTEFKLDKAWMKNECGFHIAFSEAELEELNTARIQLGQPELSEEELDYYRHQVGEIILITGVSADHGFDALFEIMEANVCQVIAVNSIGYLQTEAKEDAESFEKFAQRSSEASLLTKVMPKFSMYLNRESVNDRPNTTTLFLIDQVRAKMNVRPIPGRPPADKELYRSASGAWALKHGKAIEMFMHNGSKIYNADKTKLLGRQKTWELTKGKLGTREGIKGEFNFFYGTGADVHTDLLSVAMGFDLLKKKGSWISYDEGNEYGFNVASAAKFAEHMRGSPEVFEYLKARCLQEAQLTYRHR